MGWLWTSTDERSKDPLRDLDPSLQDFLKKESPHKYESSTSEAPPTPSSPPPPDSVPTIQDEKPAVSYPTRFKDGRYSELWKTYTPLNDIEHSNKSDQEKISDVIDTYKFRKAEINRAALENCALEQWAVQDCFDKGGWSAKATMCRTENRAFNRCYELQAKFLKALGYLSSGLDKESELNEQIQMHADTLYQRMLKQEKDIAAAKAEGREIPTFPPLLSNQFKFVPQTRSDKKAIQVEDLAPQVQAGFKKRLEGLSGEERELEERAIKAELQNGEDLARNLGEVYEKQMRERAERKAQGRETITDKLNTILGFRGTKPGGGSSEGAK